MIKKTQDTRRKTQDRSGFSLMEVLLAVGTLAVGMLFIAGVFPVSIHFTTVASERTIAAVVADEAFAKIKLYGVNLSDSDLSYVSQAAFEDVNLSLVSAGEFAYPSTLTTDPYSKRYWWSAICRRVGPADVQVTVFVSRKVGVSATRPVAVRVPFSVVLPTPTYELALTPGNRMKIGDGCTIVDNESGQIYRVLSRTDTATNGIIKLDKFWQGGTTDVWVIPPPTGGGRYPCIAVYQKVMSF